ncbi:uncharacterized protein si:dkeyp-97a10.2, partial [Coregonus clupeaformis]|uniref:uncharacterized protein si:dkeyp-97a10.2 n=1 Tax=Coregonus clupeaformis TaxID=59861 RepID=UPI001E1C707A
FQDLYFFLSRLLSKFLICFLLTASYFSSHHHQASTHIVTSQRNHPLFSLHSVSLFLLFETIFGSNFQVSPFSHLVSFSFLCLLSFLSEAVHHPSVRVNVSHSSLFCVETWGTDLKFSWLHERAAITDVVGHVSPDGKTLFVSSAPICGHFTCMVSNKLGHSSATYTAEPCEREGKRTTVAVVSVIILLVCGAALAFLLWRRHKLYSNRGERLQEHFEDNL